MTPPLDLSRFVSRLTTLGLDAQLVAWHMIDTGGRKSIYELARFFDNRENREQIHRTAAALKARAARGQAFHDDVTRQHYGASELPSFPKRALSVIDGGLSDGAPIISSPDLGSIYLSENQHGWLVTHKHPKHGRAIVPACNLPSRTAAMTEAFRHALFVLTLIESDNADSGSAA